MSFFCEPFSVKSGIEPVLLCRSIVTSTGWLTTSTPLIVLKKQGNPKVCQKIQVYKGNISNTKISKNLHIFHLWKYHYKWCKICKYNTYFWLIKVKSYIILYNPILNPTSKISKFGTSSLSCLSNLLFKLQHFSKIQDYFWKVKNGQK